LSGIPGLRIRDGKGEVVPCHDRAADRPGRRRKGKGLKSLSGDKKALEAFDAW
jgi:hypothetical protein